MGSITLSAVVDMIAPLLSLRDFGYQNRIIDGDNR